MTEKKKYAVHYTPFSEYSELFPLIKMTRDDNGILLVRFHKDEGEFSWSWDAHTQVSRLWNLIGLDPENRVIILTGTGEAFLNQHNSRAGGSDPISDNDPLNWGLRQQESRRMLLDLLEIEQPIIAALNGPVTYHSHIPLLSDIILATPDTYVGETHIPYTLPGDGHHVVWPIVMGLNRAKYLLLTDQSISVDKLHEIGVVSEIIEREDLVPRAMQIARNLCRMDYVALRYFRTVTTQRVKHEMLENLTLGLALQGYGLLRNVQPTPGGRFGELGTKLAGWSTYDE